MGVTDPHFLFNVIFINMNYRKIIRKVINEIIDKTGAAIDIEDSGLIFVTAEKEEAAKKADEEEKN